MENIALTVQRESVLFFKVDTNSENFEFSDGGKRVNGIPCKSLQRLCQNHIHKTILTICNHLIFYYTKEQSWFIGAFYLTLTIQSAVSKFVVIFLCAIHECCSSTVSVSKLMKLIFPMFSSLPSFSIFVSSKNS